MEVLSLHQRGPPPGAYGDGGGDGSGVVVAMVMVNVVCFDGRFVFQGAQRYPSYLVLSCLFVCTKECK